MLDKQIKLYEYLSEKGYFSKVQFLSNECSSASLITSEKKKIEFTLVTSHQHCANAVKRAIGTFEDLFLLGLVSTDPSFPLYFWNRLIP